MRALEEHIADLARQLDDLSDIVTRQQAEIERLTRRVELLMQREAERETAEGGQAVFGDDRPPPHW